MRNITLVFISAISVLLQIGGALLVLKAMIIKDYETYIKLIFAHALFIELFSFGIKAQIIRKDFFKSKINHSNFFFFTWFTGLMASLFTFIFFHQRISLTVVIFLFFSSFISLKKIESLNEQHTGYKIYILSTLLPSLVLLTFRLIGYFLEFNSIEFYYGLLTITQIITVTVLFSINRLTLGTFRKESFSQFSIQNISKYSLNGILNVIFLRVDMIIFFVFPQLNAVLFDTLSKLFRPINIATAVLSNTLTFNLLRDKKGNTKKTLLGFFSISFLYASSLFIVLQFVNLPLIYTTSELVWIYVSLFFIVVAQLLHSITKQIIIFQDRYSLLTKRLLLSLLPLLLLLIIDVSTERVLILILLSRLISLLISRDYVKEILQTGFISSK
jgi:hypothetical protein